MSEIQGKLQSIAKKYMEECYELGKVHGAIGELEKVRQEIESKYWEDFDSNTVISNHEIDEIFDKHLSKLKGEQNNG